tara:strand:- start:64 stop:225 length:162 start_codon:yes stop_codon:yes gene_type:complete
MSMLSSYIKRQIKKRGTKAFILKVLDTIVKLTPSKKDDEMVAKMKSVMADFDD